MQSKLRYPNIFCVDADHWIFKIVRTICVITIYISLLRSIAMKHCKFSNARIFNEKFCSVSSSPSFMEAVAIVATHYFHVAKKLKQILQCKSHPFLFQFRGLKSPVAHSFLSIFWVTSWRDGHSLLIPGPIWRNEALIRMIYIVNISRVYRISWILWVTVF